MQMDAVHVNKMKNVTTKRFLPTDLKDATSRDRKESKVHEIIT